MQNRKFTVSVDLSAVTTTNLFNPGTITGGVNSPGTTLYALIQQIRVTNRTGAAVNFALWRGATGANVNAFVFGGAATAGTLTQGHAVPANGSVEDFSPGFRFDSTDFLVGGASAVGLTLHISGEIGVAG